MEFWLDSTNVDAIKQIGKIIPLKGVTTNPSLIAQSGEPLDKIIPKILASQPGPVTIQVTEMHYSGMMQQAQSFRKYSEKIIIKLPVTSTGLEAISNLTRQGIATMATVVFHPNQVLQAASAGATYIAPYVSRMQRAGLDAFGFLESMLEILKKQNFSSKLLAASIFDVDQITQCARMGMHAITLKEALFETFLVDNSLTLESLKKFAEEKTY